MNQIGGNNETVGAVAWDPQRYLSRVNSIEARYSMGFLRCRPERWFPGFASHWLPLAHSLGVSFKVMDIRPVAKCPTFSKRSSYVCSVDNEYLLVSIDDNSVGPILNAVVSGATIKAGDLVLEYLAMRFLGSLMASWSGPETSVVRFESEMDPVSANGVVAVKLQVEVNATHCTVWVVLGQVLADRLDGLWRRQLKLAGKQAAGLHDLRIELAELAVPPASITDYLGTGATIDLEIPVGDNVVLKLDGKPWLPGKLCSVNNGFGVELLQGPAPALSLPEGTTRISIEIGGAQVDGAQIAELAQPGAIWQSGISLNDRVGLVINSEKVGEGQLCCYQGRFAIIVS